MNSATAPITATPPATIPAISRAESPLRLLLVVAACGARVVSGDAVTSGDADGAGESVGALEAAGPVACDIAVGFGACAVAFGVATVFAKIVTVTSGSRT
jgi:hypothetical protein